LSFGNPRGTFLIRESETTKGRLAKAFLTTNVKACEEKKINHAKFVKYRVQCYKGREKCHVASMCARELDVWKIPRLWSERLKQRATQEHLVPN